MSPVRPATTADVDAVAALERSALGGDAWSRRLVAEGIAEALPTVAYLVAPGAEAGVAGYAVVSCAGEDAELQRIAVEEASRRAGVGGRLLDAVLERAAASGATRLLLEVREDNAAALGFYLAHGFAELARRRRYYRDGATALVLARPVRRAMMEE